MKRLITLFWRRWYRHHPEPSKFTRAEALDIARKYKLESEVITAMEHGCSPDEALQEWDLYPYDESK